MKSATVGMPSEGTGLCGMPFSSQLLPLPLLLRKGKPVPEALHSFVLVSPFALAFSTPGTAHLLVLGELRSIFAVSEMV